MLAETTGKPLARCGAFRGRGSNRNNIVSCSRLRDRRRPRYPSHIQISGKRKAALLSVYSGLSAKRPKPYGSKTAKAWSERMNWSHACAAAGCGAPATIAALYWAVV